MKIRITAVSSEAIGARLGEITISMQDSLAPRFMDLNNGVVDELMVVVVAVDSNPKENEKFAKGFNKFATVKNPFTGEKRGVLSVSLSYDPQRLSDMDDEEMRSEIVRSLIEQLKHPDAKRPKKSDYDTFAADIISEISSLI